MNWVIETERWNWNDIDEPGPENNCQTNMEDLEKKSVLRQRPSLYTREEIQNTFIVMSASDSGQPIIQTEKANVQKYFFYNTPLVCKISRWCQK